ncbi:MAG TPA: hypothetical protein DCZ75_13205 [Geobacter sp.]|nr:hypothetical protein [Geobacter sp.]
MRGTIGLAVCAGMLMAGVQAYGWGLPGVGSLFPKESGAKVDVGALTVREAVLKVRVNMATVSLASGLIEVQKACGKATEAARLEAALAEAKKNPSDIEGTKKLCAEVNNASAAMNRVDLDATMNKDEARLRLGKSLLYLGVGSLLDLQASNDARSLVGDITGSLKAVQASPATYGLSAAVNLTSGLSTAKFVAETVPGQLTSISQLTRGLVKYAETNKIEIPSRSEQEKMAAAMEKE